MPFSIGKNIKTLAANIFRGAALWQEIRTREVAVGYRGIADALDGTTQPKKPTPPSPTP